MKYRHTASHKFIFEQELFDKGVTVVAGVDEAGCGPLAGPVVAAAAILPIEWLAGLPPELEGLNDSKQLTPRQREQFFVALTSGGKVRFAIAQSEANIVDRLNILRASHRAMNRALARLAPTPQHVLVDGFRVNTMRFAQTPIVDGDARSYSIASASVLAKVTRDRLMIAYHQRWPAYGFAEHKGYGTPRHLAALVQHGPCPIHRRSFLPLKNLNLKSNLAPLT
jgi:ribonuclease HII